MESWFKRKRTGSYAPNCVSSYGLKATDIFVILLSQDGFESDFPETKFRSKQSLFKVCSEAAVRRCSSK